jgi:carboxymethylenebutenolidase
MKQGKMITVAAGDGHEFDAYLTGSTGAPVVLLFPAIFGLEERVLAMADRWAAEGYVIAVPDFLSRAEAKGVIERGEEGMKRAFARWNEIDTVRSIEDSGALLAELKRQGHATERFGALGYCAGGEMVWLAATRLGAAVGAGFHPSRLTRHLAEADKIKGSLGFHFGGQDRAVPLAEVAEVQAALATNPRSEVHLYGGAQHGFTFTDLPSYHALAERVSRERTLDMLRAAFFRQE